MLINNNKQQLNNKTKVEHWTATKSTTDKHRGDCSGRCKLFSPLQRVASYTKIHLKLQTYTVAIVSIKETNFYLYLKIFAWKTRV